MHEFDVKPLPHLMSMCRLPCWSTANYTAAEHKDLQGVCLATSNNGKEEEDDSRASSTLDHHHLVKTDSKLANDINLPSPPSSTRSSFDNDGVTRDSFFSSGGDNSENAAEVSAHFGSFALHNNSDAEMNLEEERGGGEGEGEGQSEQPTMMVEQQQQMMDESSELEATFEDDIKLITESLVNTVVEEAQSDAAAATDAAATTTNDTQSEPTAKTNGVCGSDPVATTATTSDIEELWKDFQINLEGETILPSGLRLVNGVAEMPFYRDPANGQSPRFTNQLNFLKTTLTKYICRYKTAMPFINPVDSVLLKIPHYYLVIRQPMDLSTVKNRINFLWYRSADECISDLRLIFSNCYQFNNPADYVYKAGKKLEEYLDDKLKEMPAVETEIPCPPMPNIEEYQKLNAKRAPAKARTGSISEHSENGEYTLFGPIKMTTRSERGVMVRKPSKDLPAPISTPQPKQPTIRKVPLNEPMKYCLEFVKELFSKKHAEYAWPFWEPVNPVEYPDYAQKIKRPVDLSLIRTNIETGKYTTINDFASDMRLMFSNCLRYNTPESPIIEQARKLREQFEFKIARVPDEWMLEKLTVAHTSHSRTTSPSVRISASGSSGGSTSSKSHGGDSHKRKSSAKGTPHESSKKNSKGRNSVDNSGHSALNIGGLFDALSSAGAGGASRMEQLERQVASLTNALQACLKYGNGGPAIAPGAGLVNILPATPIQNGTTTAPSRGRPRKNGMPAQPRNLNNGSKKAPKKQSASSRKRKHHLSSDEESDSDQEELGQVDEPFSPHDIEDLKKLKNDLENLRAKDLQNVLRILQKSEPSLRCDDESNVEIDFEALQPKTLVELRKYVTSCMLNQSSPANHHSAPTGPTATTSANSGSGSSKRLCKPNSNRSASILDTDCDTPTINNWSRAGSRASDLQLSESSSDSELDD